jgi:VWFA-related protein
MLLVVVAPDLRSDDPVTIADLVRFLRAGISERIVLAEVRDRGVAEPLGAEGEASLREAGASETLVVAVRRAAPEAAAVAATPAPPPPARPAVPVEGPAGLTFGTSARSVRVPVSVLDKHGEPVLGLRGEDFHVSEDGRAQPVTFFSGQRRPLRIALALDVSASMRGKMDDVADALRHFIDLLEPADEILVITFSETVSVDQGFTSDRDLLERVFSRLQPGEGTALYDAAVEAIRRVAPGPAESKAVVIVSDGMDTASSTTLTELLDLARHSEVPVFSIGLGGGDASFFDLLRNPTGVRRPPVRPPGGRGGWPGGGGVGGWPGRGWPGGGGGGGTGWPGGGGGGPRGPGSTDFDGRVLIELADDTGGRAEILKGLHNDRGKGGRLKHAVESIAVTLRHRYLVGYEPRTGKRGWRKIEVDVDRSSVRVQARRGYYSEG